MNAILGFDEKPANRVQLGRMITRVIGRILEDQMVGIENDLQMGSGECSESCFKYHESIAHKRVAKALATMNVTPSAAIACVERYANEKLIRAENLQEEHSDYESARSDFFAVQTIAAVIEDAFILI